MIAWLLMLGCMSCLVRWLILFLLWCLLWHVYLLLVVSFVCYFIDLFGVYRLVCYIVMLCWLLVCVFCGFAPTDLGCLCVCFLLYPLLWLLVDSVDFGVIVSLFVLTWWLFGFLTLLFVGCCCLVLLLVFVGFGDESAYCSVFV